MSVTVNASLNVQLTEREHLLERPENYIRTVVTARLPNVVCMTRDGRLEQRKDRLINPGLVHLPVEIISNATDNAAKNGDVQRLQSALAKRGKRSVEDICKSSGALVEVELTPRSMAVKNYGAPFDIDFMHGDNSILIPEACFTRTKVGSNFDDDGKPRMGVGRNGIGAKLPLTYSKEFVLECVDVQRRRYFRLETRGNADPSRTIRRLWPDPIRVGDGMLRVPNGGNPPPDIAHLFTAQNARSYTRVYWVPDSEEGDLSQEAIADLGMQMNKGDMIIVRRMTPLSESEEVRMTVTAGGNDPYATPDGKTNVRLLSVPNMRLIRIVRTRQSVPGTALIFQGGSWIRDDEIDLVARYVLDFAVCGIPFILRRLWEDGQADERFVPPMDVLQYGTLMFGPEVPHYAFDWQSKDSQVSCSVAYFDTPNSAVQMGFVNGLWADQGLHMRAAHSALFGEVKKHPEIMKYAPNCDVGDFKRHVSTVVSCSGLNPKQEGQTKTDLTMISGKKSFTMTTTVNGKTVSIVPENVVSAICSGQRMWKAVSALMDAGRRIEIHELKATVGKRKVDGFLPANKEGPDAVLILTEGDSCKTYAAVMKNQQADSDRFGIMPMRGVPANLYGSTIAQLLGNALFASLVKVMGLDPEKTYDDQNDLKKLRYGSIVFMGDPDLDGFHIVAIMLANLLHYWPFLFSQRRVGALRTPVVRVYDRRQNVLARYYSDREYEEAVKSGSAPSGEVKRIKGLGSVDVGKLDRPGAELLDDVGHASVMWFHMTSDGHAALHDFFANGRSAERKVHITRLAGACTETAGLHVKSAECTIPSMGNAPLLQRDVSSYVEKELIQYCLGSLERAIPRAHDGLKDVQRKIMAWWLEHNQFGRTNSKRKVDQLAGTISEKQHYHHGPQSIGAAIKRMALEGFPGANNLGLLHSESNVGSKLNFPKDAAADRYAIVRGADWLKYAFHKHLYESIPRVVSDGDNIEPFWIPCDVPIALINGVNGISTGWRTYIPPCHPGSVIAWLRERASADLDGRMPNPPEVPFWYVGFRGTLQMVYGQQYAVVPPADADADADANADAGTETVSNAPDEEPITVCRTICARGVYELIDPPPKSPSSVVKMLVITEVPPETRLDDLTAAIQDMRDNGHVATFTYDTKHGIDYRLGMTASGLALGQEEVERRLKLVARYPLTMFNFLNSVGAPMNFATVYEYLEFFYGNIIDAYELGRQRMIAQLREKEDELLAKQRYIMACVNGTIKLGNMPRSELAAVMSTLKIPDSMTKTDGKDITPEGADEIGRIVTEKQAEIAKLESIRPAQMYYDNLVILEKELPKSPPPVRKTVDTWGPGI